MDRRPDCKRLPLALLEDSVGEPWGACVRPRLFRCDSVHAVRKKIQSDFVKTKNFYLAKTPLKE